MVISKCELNLSTEFESQSNDFSIHSRASLYSKHFNTHVIHTKKTKTIILTFSHIHHVESINAIDDC